MLRSELSGRRGMTGVLVIPPSRPVEALEINGHAVSHLVHPFFCPLCRSMQSFEDINTFHVFPGAETEQGALALVRFYQSVTHIALWYYNPNALPMGSACKNKYNRLTSPFHLKGTKFFCGTMRQRHCSNLYIPDRNLWATFSPGKEGRSPSRRRFASHWTPRHDQVAQSFLEE